MAITTSNFYWSGNGRYQKMDEIIVAAAIEQNIALEA